MHRTMGKDHDIQTVPSSTTTLTLLIFVLKITQRHLFGSISRVSMLWKINEFEKWAPHKLTVYAQQNLNRHPKGRNELNEFFIRIQLSSKCIFLDQWVCYGSMFWTFFCFLWKYYESFCDKNMNDDRKSFHYDTFMMILDIIFTRMF